MIEQKAQQVVLFLHPSAERRGADRTLLQLVAAVDTSRWTPVVALPRRGPLIGELEALGATIEVGALGVVGQGFGPFRALGFFSRLPMSATFLWRLLRRHRPAVVHTHTAAVVGGAIAARFLAGGRHIWHVHRVLPPKGLGARLRARFIHSMTDSVVCSSAAAKEALEAHVPAIAPKCRIVRGSVDAQRVAPVAGAREALRAKIGLEDDSPLVVVVAHLKPSKGHRMMIEVAKRLRYTHPDTRFLFVGDPVPGDKGYHKALHEEIDEAQLRGIITRMGSQADVASIYAAADIVCVPSLTPDTVQMVPLEAMAAGKPLVAAAHPGTSEHIGQDESHGYGTHGLLFEPGDVERLTWCIGTLSGDPQRRYAMAHGAMATHAASFLPARFKNEFDRAWSQSVHRAFCLPVSRARIVHLSLGKVNPERSNGINQVVHNLASTQTAMGLTVEYWGITPTPDAETPARPYPLRLFRAGRSRFHLDGTLVDAIDGLDTTAVVHLHGAFLPELRAVAKRLTKRGIPYVVTPHGAFMRHALQKRRRTKALWIWLSEKHMLRNARAVQALSGRELIEMEHIAGEERLQAIPNGQAALPAIEPTPVPPETKRPVFVFCGRLAAHTKGLDALIAGFARYIASRGRGTLWIVGEGDDRQVLEALAVDLGVSRRVTFFGPLFGEEKLARLAQANAFVHPSRHEGMPTAVLEAGALGLPLLVSPGTNLDQNVREASAGTIVQEVTPEAIGEALLGMEREHDSGALTQRGQNAAWMVANHFSWERVASLIALELYGLDFTPIAAAPPHLDPLSTGDTTRRSA